MPVLIEALAPRVGCTHIAVYTKAEIVAAFQQFKYLHRADIVGDRPYLICQANCLDEALVLTALMIRETNVTPSCFYYDSEAGKLYACCDVLSFDETYLRRSFTKIIHKYTSHIVLRHLIVDMAGSPLFHTPDLMKRSSHSNVATTHSPEAYGPPDPTPSQDAADAFHMERNLPFHTSKFPIHPSLTINVLKQIVNPSDTEEPR